MSVYKPFSETQIRPDNLMVDHQELLQQDRDFVLRYSKDFVDVNCPACESINRTKHYDKAGFSFATCTDCETDYVNPRPTPEILSDYHCNSVVYDYWNKNVFPQSEEARRQYLYQPRLEHLVRLCSQYGIERPSLVEVGAGFGTFCEEAGKSKQFERVIAVEPSPFLAETCRKKGVNVVESPIERITKFENKVNLIVSFEVIEHLFNPADFVRKCTDLLEPGGLLLLTCPNIHGFDILTLQSAHDQVEFEHLNYFNPKSLSILVERSGLKVLEVLTPGKLDAELVRKKILSSAYDASEDRFIRHVLIDRWNDLGEKFQTFLSENLLSSHLWVVARKPA